MHLTAMQQYVLEQPNRTFSRELRTELVRKTIHFSIALTPAVAALLGTGVTLALLGAGILVYTAAETARQQGRDVPVVSRLTVLSSRSRDLNHFVLGPITLGTGAMLALMLYPDPAASIAIYALAFGDGVASLAGKLLGRTRMRWTGGKTLEGSLACALAVAAATWTVYPVPMVVVITALTATFLEMLPTADADNLILPVGTGMVVVLLV